MKRSDEFFSADYVTAKRRFLDLSVRAGARMEILPIEARGPNSEELSIDIAWIGAAIPRRVLLHSCGLHGIEGFAGSAIQLLLLGDLPPLPSDTALVLVHVLNPYGMAWLRRVNENNIDLNRNFRVNGSFDGAPAAYGQLDRFLNPPSQPASDWYFAKATYLIMRFGMTALKQTVVGGQYEFPKGLFFGGKQLQEGPRRYERFLSERLGAVDKAIVIDVHTGIGKFAEDALLVESEDYFQLRDQFGRRVTALQPDQGPAYRIEGGLQSMIFRIFSNRPIFICQEFGTYSGMKVLHALREENRWHHYGAGTLDHATKRNIKESFCPNDDAWRDAVLKRGRELFEQSLAELKSDR